MSKAIIKSRFLWSPRFMFSSSLSSKIIDGKVLAAQKKETIKANIQKRLCKQYWILVAHEESKLKPPCLATLQVGNRHDSSLYLKMKHKACQDVGILNRGKHPLISDATFPVDISMASLIE